MIHPTADVSGLARIGERTKVWHQSQIREHTVIGDDCVIAKNVYIDHHVTIGNKVKIQNNCSIYQAEISEGVFIGPHVCFTNDKVPRAIDTEGNLKSGGTEAGDWEISSIRVGKGASVGAHSVLLPGVSIGAFAMIGAGSVVSRNVPDYALVYGNPARVQGYVCRCGEKLNTEQKAGDFCLRCEKS